MDIIYKYSKKHGWSPVIDDPATYVKMTDGRIFKLEVRKPNPGERVMQIRHRHPQFTNLQDIILIDMICRWFQETNPRLRSFYLVPPNGYLHGHHTIVVEQL